MNESSTRTGWARWCLVALFVAGGAVSGLYLSGGWPTGEEKGQTHSAVPPTLHRFPLSVLDVKDTIEAPSLAMDATGRAFLAWASKTGERERTVFLRVSADAGTTFEVPKTIAKGGLYRSAAKGKGKSGGYERRATPHVVAGTDRLSLVWSEAAPDGSGLSMLLAESSDAGATFSPAQPVHRSDRATPAFTALTQGQDGSLACVWLDSRKGPQQPYAAIRPAGGSTFDAERLVAAGDENVGVCPCCPTAAAFAPDGSLYVAFRDVRAGYRDIAVGRLRPGATAFDAAVPVLPANTWKFDGCPHDGPSLAVVGDALHVVWMDAHTGSPRCYHARAKLADLRFESQELHAIPSGSQGNAKLWADQDGGLHAVWEESAVAEPSEASGGHRHGPPSIGAGGSRAIMHAYQPPRGSAFGPPRAVAPKAGAFQTRPVMAGSLTGTPLVAWNELDESGKAVVVVRLANSAREAQP